MVSADASLLPARAKKQDKEALTAAELAILRDYCEQLEGNRLRITRQLDATSYDRMRMIFERLGGVYMPGRKCFAYECDPAPLLERTIALARLPEKNPLDFYWSPPPVVEALLQELESGNTMQDLLWLYEHRGRPIRMIELSAGLGHLADAFRARYPMAIIDVCELDLYRGAVLQSKGYRVVAEDAFDYHAKPADFYDVVLLNPPFSIRGDTFTFIKFIKHAYDMLCDNEWSKLVSVVPAQFSSVKRYRDFLIFVLQYGRYDTLPEGSFAEAGTTWDTSIISLGKRLNHFYATWDEPDTEDGFPNKRVREAWRYISVDQQLGSAEQAIIDDLLEGRLVVYSNGCVAAATRERIWSFCQQVTEHLLKAYQAYIPIKEADYEGMERHILFEYQLQHSQYAQSMQWAWERERERRRDALQAEIDKTEKRIRSDRVQLSRSEQELALRRETLAALQGEQTPTYRPAKQPPPPGDQLTEEYCTSHTAPVVTQDRPQERSHPTRYTQIAFF